VGACDSAFKRSILKSPAIQHKYLLLVITDNKIVNRTCYNFIYLFIYLFKNIHQTIVYKVNKYINIDSL